MGHINQLQATASIRKNGQKKREEKRNKRFYKREFYIIIFKINNILNKKRKEMIKKWQIYWDR